MRIVRKHNGGGRVREDANLPHHIFSLLRHWRNQYTHPDIEEHPRYNGQTDDEHRWE